MPSFNGLRKVMSNIITLTQRWYAPYSAMALFFNLPGSAAEADSSVLGHFRARQGKLGTILPQSIIIIIIIQLKPMKI